MSDGFLIEKLKNFLNISLSPNSWCNLESSCLLLIAFLEPFASSALGSS